MGHHHDQRVPRSVIAAAAVLMAATIGLAALGRARVAPEAEPTDSHVELRFEDRASGEVAVLDHRTGREVLVVPAESGGFVRGVLRGVYRTRHLESVGQEPPLRLGYRADGELVLSDPETGHQVELRSFGHTNHESFVAILEAAEASR